MQANNWKQNLHLEPTKGWLNDPNGLAYFKGKYHIFCQYSYEVDGGLKLWYYHTSSDLKNYEDKGVFLTPTIEEEKSGVYSGSASIENDKLVFYYTGNVKYKGDYDYVHAGRGHNTITFSTEDGINFSEKTCLLTTDDYPNMSNHVRDPKVFEKNGKKYLILGARDSNDYGCLLIYDKDTLEHYKTIYSKNNLGFMWECPDYFEVDGTEIFIFSPQGISRMYPYFENTYQIGYSVVNEGLESVERFDNFNLLDYGHDFYASQTFLDEDNNRVLIGWMYVPDSSYTNPTTKFGYQNCLTVPRVVNFKNGKIRQTLHKSVRDLLGERIFKNIFSEQTWYYSQEHGESFKIQIADFKVSYNNNELEINFGTSGYGRNDRKYKLNLENVEIVFDSSSIELFANNGEFVISTRFYPKNHNVEISANSFIAQKIEKIEIKKI
ncbi:glycoside hydrolase family 32 protein [Gemella cuniculi]|uniref:glycoside hydrolase family 32 protein n=1 Tax=Gemella cuniculi TaxID=150240 RepID=UPI0004194159|nr:glycoside hydrolase family 32 protein [Gemella cuniculi]